VAVAGGAVDFLSRFPGDSRASRWTGAARAVPNEIGEIHLARKEFNVRLFLCSLFWMAACAAPDEDQTWRAGSALSIAPQASVASSPTQPPPAALPFLAHPPAAVPLHQT